MSGTNSGGGGADGKPSSGGGGNGNEEYTKINWEAPGQQHNHTDAVSTKNATIALKTAIAVARAFDANCALRNPVKECTVPMFESQELSLGGPIRSVGFFTDMHLQFIELADDEDLIHGAFGDDEQECRIRFMERTHDGPYYAAKFLQKGIYNSVHAASAASDMMMETKILMNLAPHPNICQIYGVTGAGSDAFLSQGKEGFFIIVDRINETLVHRMQIWKKRQVEQQQVAQDKLKSATGTEEQSKIQHEYALQEYQQLMERLEVALDIGSALLFLSDRQLVFHLRPDKVGFDARYDRIKLCDFGQAREHGQIDQAPSLAKSDDIRTLAYTAPEVLCQAPVTVSADVYAYGVLLWTLLSLQPPFENLTRAEHFERVVMNDERPSTNDYKHLWPKSIRKLIDNCWDPHFRPTMKKVYDTVEEILLFQDDEAPTISTSATPVLLPPKTSISTSTDGGGGTGTGKADGNHHKKSSSSTSTAKKGGKPGRTKSGDKRVSTKKATSSDAAGHSSDPKVGRQKSKESKRKERTSGTTGNNNE